MGLKDNPSYEDVFGKTPITDNKMYGVDKPKLVADIEVEGGGSGGNNGGAEIRYFTFDNAAGTGTQSYAGFSFKPSSYTIQAWLSQNSDYMSNSYGVNQDGASSSYYNRPRATGGGTSNGHFVTTSSLVNIYREDLVFTKGVHSSFTSDGIMIDWTNAGVDVRFTITAYS